MGNFGTGFLLHVFGDWPIVFITFGVYGAIQALLFVRISFLPKSTQFERYSVSL